MKKICLFTLIISCLLLTGCGDDKFRSVATLEQFELAAREEGFTVSINQEYADVDYILDSRMATYDGDGDGYDENDTADILVEMIKYSSIDNANKVQNAQIDDFNLLKTTALFEDKEKGDNYYSYELVSNNRYMVSTRVEDTLIFCKTLVNNKEKVEEIIDELDY